MDLEGFNLCKYDVTSDLVARNDLPERRMTMATDPLLMFSGWRDREARQGQGLLGPLVIDLAFDWPA